MPCTRPWKVNGDAGPYTFMPGVRSCKTWIWHECVWTCVTICLARLRTGHNVYAGPYMCTPRGKVYATVLNLLYFLFFNWLYLLLTLVNLVGAVKAIIIYWKIAIILQLNFLLCFGNEASRTRFVCLPIATPSCLDTTLKKVPKPYKRECYDVIKIGYRLD